MAQELVGQGYTSFQAGDLLESLGPVARAEFGQVESTFEALVQDTQMGDRGRYRFRRFSRFRLTRSEDGKLDWELIPGNSIHQLKRDNPLNGGVTRTFEPLSPELLKSEFLASLLSHDVGVVSSVDPEFVTGSVVMGVHQVRIVATPGEGGKPTPEGVHRDAERYTFQHFWQRRNVEGGEFIAYDQQKRETFRWLQTERLESVLFCGTTWHSATPVSCLSGCDQGHRDIFLVDFDPL